MQVHTYNLQLYGGHLVDKCQFPCYFTTCIMFLTYASVALREIVN